MARADLATRIMARVETVAVREGDRVHKGQVLATFERGAVLAAGAQARAGLDLATTNLRRMERLYADSAVPVAQLEAARAAYQQAEGHQSAAAAELAYASLVAPFDGVVTRRAVDPGDLAAPGQPIVVVEGGGPREIVVGVPESVARGLVVGTTVTARIGVDERAVPARIAAIVPSADAVDRTVEVRLTTDGQLTANLAAIVEFPPIGARLELRVPASAVVERGELTGVFLFAPDSTVRLRWVRLGRRLGPELPVVAGLVPGDLVVRVAEGAVDGDRARPVLAGARP
jgi:RND family efflux transporter MFP subunit